MTDEPDDGRIMTTSLPPDRISLFSNFDDAESWLVPVEDKSGDLSDWLEGAMKDFDKSALKKQKRRLQQNNTSGCGLITEEDEPSLTSDLLEDNETFFDAETEFENEKVSKPVQQNSVSPRNDVSKPLTLGTSHPLGTPNSISTPKAASVSPHSRPASNASGASDKRIPDLAELERKAEEQERELQEMLMKTLSSRPQSSASNAADMSARSTCSVRQSSTSPSLQDTSTCSLPASSQHKKSLLRSKIPIPERNPFMPLSARKAHNGISATGSHIPVPLGLRPSSSSNSDTSSNPDQWAGANF